jgi:hypothetical protein
MTLFQAQFVGLGVSLKTPTADGTAGQVVKTDGSGNLSFAYGDWFDQSVKQAASPTFAAATLTGTLTVTKTTEQARVRYDADNYFTVTVGSTGTVTLDAAGSGAGFVFSDKVGVKRSLAAAAGYVLEVGGGVWCEASSQVDFMIKSTGASAIQKIDRPSDTYVAGLALSNAEVIQWRVYLAASTSDFRILDSSNTSAFSITQTTRLVGIGVEAASAKLHVVSTTEQLRVGYDADNYFSVTVGSTGAVTLNAVGAGALFAFSDVVKAAGYQSSDGSAGLTQDVTVRNAAGDGTTTLTFKNGLLTAVA